MIKKITLNQGQKGAIHLFNEQDKLILSLILKDGENEVDLYNIPLNAGIYSYKISVDDKIIEHKNLVIIA